MSEESLNRYLNAIQDEVSIKIINFAKTPRTTDEIIVEIWQFLRNRYPNLYDERMKAGSAVAVKLGTLERIGAIAYSDGKWQTTKQFLEILSKYFGI